jgi:hypothetical protein
MAISTKEEIKAFPVTKDDLLRLSQYHNSFCVSIYIPTHRAGFETLKGQDSLNLKNQLKEIRLKLNQLGMNSREIESFTNPILDLVEDADFWRHQSEGLVVFLSHNIFEKYTVPVRFDEFNYISSEFYLKQLLPVYNNNGVFHLLTLKKDEIRLYQCNRFGLNPIDITDSVPSRLEDTVGYDYEQKQLQFRTTGGINGSSPHGHGEGEARKKNELLLFFRDVDKGIMSKLHEFQQFPLVVCCIDYYFPVYREANTHANLYPQFASCNPADLDARSLHQKAWQVIEPYFTRAFHEKKERFFIGTDKGKASSNIREIIPAAIQGKIETLFLEKNADVFGIYDPSTGGISIQEEQSIANVSLMNMAAKKVFEQGGSVYLLNKEDMPEPSSEINALFRY